ncbi:hypothetical protein BDN71DRAFT_1441346 [Pleurotus eryngii]|uniref:Nuclear protein DGCR14 n=1 Tax=Pleurotus eryngii TaxID=5323 RepID=A0A9P6A4B2_PLEER|nr:hypothetical protein BDN71DRAFT_1441346 [Pleurotus eryngii]
MADNLPTSERSLNGQAVLEEDEYTDALSHIIARDFFPSLVHLDAAHQYLDALKTEDSSLINQSVRRLEQLSSTPALPRNAVTPSQTPYGLGGETPLRTPRTLGDEPPSKRARYDPDISLDTFQARYTSEDNSSFTKILDDENRKRRDRWAWAWEAQQRVEGQKAKAIEGRERMLIEGPSVTGVRERFMIDAPKPVGLITEGEKEDEESEKEKGKGKELVLQSEDDQPVDVMAPKKDTRPAGVDGWRFNARNSLMFPPDANESPYHPSTSAVTTPNSKVVLHNNTRLPEQEESSNFSRSSSAPPSPTRSRIDAAISGTPYRPRSPPGTFSLVPDLPSPTPSELGPKAVQQLMTWGTLMGTPRVISSGDDDIPTPSTPFRIAAPSSRESLSHRLSNDASRRLRAKADLINGGRTPSHSLGKKSMSALGATVRKGAMPPPSWTPQRNVAATPGSLTPAAKRLLDRTTLGTAATRRAEAMTRSAGWEDRQHEKEKELDKVRWTPTPSPATRRVL